MSDEPKFLIVLVLCCFGVGTCIETYAKQKRPRITSVYLEKKMTVKGPRSVILPVHAVLSPDGNTITLHSSENCDQAFVTISGNGICLTDMVNFTDQTATLDVSDLDCGVFLITVEYENGAIYTGQFEFTE
jgi:hypothetical protein